MHLCEKCIRKITVNEKPIREYLLDKDWERISKALKDCGSAAKTLNVMDLTGTTKEAP